MTRLATSTTPRMMHCLVFAASAMRMHEATKMLTVQAPACFTVNRSARIACRTVQAAATQLRRVTNGVRVSLQERLCLNSSSSKRKPGQEESRTHLQSMVGATADVRVMLAWCLMLVHDMLP